jgi:hypothetical protein
MQAIDVKEQPVLQNVPVSMNWKPISKGFQPVTRTGGEWSSQSDISSPGAPDFVKKGGDGSPRTVWNGYEANCAWRRPVVNC